MPGCRSQHQSSPKAWTLLGGRRDALTSVTLLRSFLVLWKQLEVLKDLWGRLRLRGWDMDPVSFHKQFSELYECMVLTWKFA